MSIKINDEAGRMELDGPEKITAYRVSPERWTVSDRPGRHFTREQAITALTITEHRAQGAGDDDPFIQGWEDELNEPDPHDVYDN